MSNEVNSVHSDVTDLYSGASSLSAMGLSGPSPTSLPSNALEKRFFLWGEVYRAIQNSKSCLFSLLYMSIYNPK